MQLDLSVVVSILGIVLSLGMGAYMAVSSYARNTRDGDVNRRLTQNEGFFMQYMQRVHADELETEKLRGQVALLQSQHTGSVDDLDEIKEKMVHRNEFEGWMKTMNDNIDSIRRELRESRRPGAYRAMTPGEMTAARPPKSGG